MFCTQCGTQIDQGKNFCKNCGARVGHSPEPVAAGAEKQTLVSPVEPAAPLSRAQSVPVPSARERSGINNKVIIVAAAVAVLVVGAAGVYFGSDLSKPTATQAPGQVAAPAAQKSAEVPPLPSFEETKDATPAGDLASVNPPSLPEPSPPGQADSPKPPSELLSQPERRADVPPPPSKSQFKRAGEEPPPAGRVSRPPPAAASRGGVSPGIYETARTTTVYEDPSASSKVLASIGPGTRINVVSSNGEWLEVHSKRGNPPGFIRRTDANFVESSN